MRQDQANIVNIHLALMLGRRQQINSQITSFSVLELNLLAYGNNTEMH
jgi:molybdopterin-binding protein